MSKLRIAVGILSVSAVGFIGMVASEGYVDRAMIPTKDDRPTLGFGSTFHEDGSPVRLGESTTPVRALITAQAHISKQEVAFRESLAGASLTQGEFDVYMDFVYQYGQGNWMGSTIRKNVLAGNYKAACDSLLQWKRAAGFDCSIPNNTRCTGVWDRQRARHAKCLEAL